MISEESEDDSEFSFITAQGIKYLVYFKEADGYVPFASFAEDAKMFGFGPTKETRPTGKLPKDAQVGIAIFEILYYYISKYPNRILLFVCSDESIWYPGAENKHPRYAKWRSNTFSEWFENWQQTGVMPAEKIDYNLYGELHCSCLFRSGNPYEVEVRQVIEQTILSKQP
ncbi:hypothetical protein [Spirosoma foliorum]|uniref:Uncharacterized protein n=1 Tax=Spirosoma foliorum TaxID=2710596 RepID=A0A7G5GPG8_9BACT|nr:hypothetical protein [Spirosoma foliorum]QMW00760.1 hypothetical protein H3H32_22565 [Spirosoma foliorum]